MPLVPTVLEKALELQLTRIGKAIEGGSIKPENAIAELAKAIASEVTTYIKTATVTVPPGIAVTTAGTAVAQTGATTAPATAIIS